MGRHSLKKVANFRALPKLAKPNDDNDNCHDNHDSNDGNFEDYDKKITKNHTNIMTFQQKYTNLRDFYLVKKGQKIENWEG